MKEYLDQNTLKLFFKIYSNNYFVYILKRIYHTTFIGTVLKYLLKDRDENNSIFETTIKKIKYCSTVVPGEHDIYRRKSRNFSAKYLPFNYSYIEKMTAEMQIKSEGNNILVGNSGHYSLNHLSVLEQLKDYSGSRKIIVPLSYGDDTYIKELTKIGYDLFGDNFIPLLDFLPADDYNKTISSCNIAIFNSTIQQAMGNIVLCIYFGLSVYLNRKNPICSFLDSLGIKYFDAVKDLKQGLKTFFPDTLARNRQLIVEYYKRDNVLNRSKIMINYILND
jgi:dTDP-N-acetylfucosamine:lipid II N-acetylfucosaminyltransferase